MNFNRKIKLFNRVYHITIVSKISDDKMIIDIADMILDKKKLAATKAMRDNFMISLSDAKTIMDNIIEAKTNGGNYFHYEFKINRKENIVSYLKSTLGTYERRI